MRETIRGFALLVPGLFDAWRLVSRRRPHVVVGVGGYSSGPVVLTAALRRVPTIVLEQNAVPGLTNRLLAPLVRAAAVTFEETARFFGPKAFVSGNPVRPEFLRAAESGPEAVGERTGFRLLVFGGSQGAHAINVAMMEAAPRLAAFGPRLEVTHQTGPQDLELVRARYREVGLEAEVAAFYDDMARRIGRADLLVCRAGATTIAEVTAAGKPAILVPLPSAADDHQRRNAEALAAAGAADLLLQADLSGEALAARVERLARNPEARGRMAAAARAMARPDAARLVADRVLELAAA